MTFSCPYIYNLIVIQREVKVMKGLIELIGKLLFKEEEKQAKSQIIGPKFPKVQKSNHFRRSKL